MKINKTGITRLVIERSNIVIKIPNFTCQWSHFLQGLLSNINEALTYRWSEKQEMLCPVIWCSWGGWILIMRKAIPCKYMDEGGEEIDYSKWIVEGLGGDDKPDNYGYYNGRIVKIDYGQ